MQRDCVHLAAKRALRISEPETPIPSTDGRTSSPKQFAIEIYPAIPLSRR
jgi:hypothetical protein